MKLPMLRPRNGTEKRAGWLPDPGVMLYVRDVLSEDFHVDVDLLPSHWIPLTIVGVLDWVILCQWWIFRNTGIYESDDPYKYVFEYSGYEFDPDQLLVFREDDSRHKFSQRRAAPGITGKERTEALPFLENDVFNSWIQGEREMTEEEAEGFIPPREFLEYAMWATFMWILDEYGRDWIYMQDEILACVFEHKAAYYSKWDESLLDPQVMHCTNRSINSCKYCGEEQWCVVGTEVDDGWVFACNHCIVKMALDGTARLDSKEDRLLHPHCPHWKGADGDSGSCLATCPHSGVTQDTVWEELEEKGSARLHAYREAVQGMDGLGPRQVAGQSYRDVVEHFDRALGGEARREIE